MSRYDPLTPATPYLGLVSSTWPVVWDVDTEGTSYVEVQAEAATRQAASGPTWPSGCARFTMTAAELRSVLQPTRPPRRDYAVEASKATVQEAAMPTENNIAGSYEAHIHAKGVHVRAAGFRATVDNPELFPFQRDAVEWALHQGRAALFEDTGLGKTVQQLEWARHVVNHAPSVGLPPRVLILAPLAVREQTIREARKFAIPGVRGAQSHSDVEDGITITNYERLDRFDLGGFAGIVLDESSILKNYTGVTKRLLVEGCADTPYKLACTATPAPNDHLELGNHAEFLGIMTSHKMIARWFITDQREAGSYRLKGHAVKPYWNWVTSWARCIGKPSDMGLYSDEGYDLPTLTVHRHFASVDIIEGRDDGQLFRQPELSATSIHRELRQTADERAEMTAALVAQEPSEPWVIWVETNYDADAVLSVLPHAVDVRGSMTPDEKCRRLLAFTDEGGVMLTKPGIAGMGLNWQHCARVAFNGLSFSYERYYQAVRRCWRFGQTRPVDVHVVLAKTQASMWGVIDRKASDHDSMKYEMFAASRRAAARTADPDPYQPTHIATLPSWLQETP